MPKIEETAQAVKIRLERYPNVDLQVALLNFVTAFKNLREY